MKIKETVHTLPIKTLNNLYHVGTLNPEDKKKGSYEGQGLSVTTHPNEWQRITPLTGQQYKTHKPNNRFLDYHKLNDNQMMAIREWAINAGWIRPTVYFNVEWFDDEYGENIAIAFLSEADAIEESENEKIISRLNGHIMTDKMKERTLSYNALINPDQLLAVIYVEDVLDLDGVWWQDRLDIFKYSAPRGVINTNKIKDWTFTEIDDN